MNTKLLNIYGMKWIITNKKYNVVEYKITSAGVVAKINLHVAEIQKLELGWGVNGDSRKGQTFLAATKAEAHDYIINHWDLWDLIKRYRI